MINKNHDDKTAVKTMLSQATDLTDNKLSYISNVQLYFSAHEVTLDLYYMGPNKSPNVAEPEVFRLHRIVLPLGVAKEMGELLQNGIARWENEFGVELPIQPLSTEANDEQGR